MRLCRFSLTNFIPPKKIRFSTRNLGAISKIFRENFSYKTGEK